MSHSMIPFAIVCFAVILSEVNVSGQYISGAFRRVPRRPTKVDRWLHPVKFTHGTVRIKGIDVFYQSAVSKNIDEPKFPVLLLHAARYTSQTWRDLGTFRLLAEAGYQAIAVDLPGYGRTRKRYSGDKSEFLRELIENLGIDKPVLVSPSMSGLYSIPFVLQHSDKLRGYVPIAPTNKGGTAQKFSRINLPALIVFGSWDSHGRRMSRMIAHIPRSQMKEVYWASHHAYVDYPDLWHKMLKDFLDGIYAEERVRLLFEDEEGSAEPQ